MRVLSQEISTIAKIAKELEHAFKKIQQLCAAYADINQDKPQEKNSKENVGTINNSKEEIKHAVNHEDKQGVNSKGEKVKKPKHPSYPKKPGSAFMIFSNQNREKIREMYPDESPAGLMSIIGRVWNEFDEKEKQPYEEAYEKEKIKFEKKLSEFLKAHPEERTKKQIKDEKKKFKT